MYLVFFLVGAKRKLAIFFLTIEDSLNLYYNIYIQLTIIVNFSILKYLINNW